MNEAYIDIETYPDYSSPVYLLKLDNLNEKVSADIMKVTPAKNLTDPIKIKASVENRKKAIEKKLEEDKEKLEANMSLSPLTARVVSTSIAFRDCNNYSEIELVTNLAKTKEEETELLQWIDMHLANRGVYRFITFSGTTFDFPFIIGRHVINHVMPKVALPYRKHAPNHYDLKDILGKGSMSDWLSCAFNTPKDIDGSQVKGIVDRKEWDVLKAYNESDVLALIKLWDSIQACIGVGNNVG
jgi:hypothetical protein